VCCKIYNLRTFSFTKQFLYFICHLEILRRTNTVSFAAFCKIQHVAYWRQQLNEANIKNLNNRNSGTKKCYTYGLYHFNNWLRGKKFRYVNSTDGLINKSSIKHATIVLKDVGHFLELYQNNHVRKLEFVSFIKQYLLWVQEHKSPAITLNALYSIKSFFRENDTELIFRFNKKKYKNTNNAILPIEDLKKILTSKNIQLIEKAVFLCKFQRGLDSSTFADRFNFEVWDQLINYFGTDDYDTWDLNRCPVPVKLVRVKTNYLHVGFLDTDAIISIQQYLKIRGQNLSKASHNRINANKLKLNKHDALFLDTSGNAISVNWIGRRFHKLYSNVILKNTFDATPTSRCSAHELRDLLKSTLVDTGCRIDVADHILGHAPKDSYEKQLLLYPSSIRHEFIKCSARINCLSKTSHQVYQDKTKSELALDSFKKPINCAHVHKEITDKINICKVNMAQIESMMLELSNNHTI